MTLRLIIPYFMEPAFICVECNIIRHEASSLCKPKPIEYFWRGDRTVEQHDREWISQPALGSS